MKFDKNCGYFGVAIFLLLAGMPVQAHGQPAEPVSSLAKREKPALLETLKTASVHRDRQSWTWRASTNSQISLREAQKPY
jgi:hypothetical protein